MVIGDGRRLYPPAAGLAPCRCLHAGGQGGHRRRGRACNRNQVGRGALRRHDRLMQVAQKVVSLARTNIIFVGIATADQSAAYISAQCCLECITACRGKSMAAAAAAAVAVAVAACGKYTYRHVHIFLFISASRVRISCSCLLYCRLIGAVAAAPRVKDDGASGDGENNDDVEDAGNSEAPELNIFAIFPFGLIRGLSAIQVAFLVFAGFWTVTQIRACVGYRARRRREM